MRPDDFFAAAARLPITSVSSFIGDGGLVIVAPHPDDESLGCGGLIAEAVAQGTEVRVIVISDGAGSHPNSRLFPPAKLRQLREDETRNAMRELGLAPSFIRFLRLPDQHVPHEGAQAEAAARAIADVARECRASTVCVTWRHDPHCDHVASARIVDRARPYLEGVRIFEYPVWGWTLSPETEAGEPPEGYRCDISTRVLEKKAAIGAHRSQTSNLINDDPEGFTLDAAMLRRFGGPFEIFLSTAANWDRPARRGNQLSEDYFERLYNSDPDPWRFATSDFEREKYKATLEALPKQRYSSILEAGCSIGVFTKSLATRCDNLLALDTSVSALEKAKSRCIEVPNISFQKAFLPGQWPSGTFDGIILSEIIYYLDSANVALLAGRVGSSIQESGDIILVHWLGETDYPLTGDQAADLFIRHASSFAKVLFQSRTSQYRLDVLRAEMSSKISEV